MGDVNRLAEMLKLSILMFSVLIHFLLSHFFFWFGMLSAILSTSLILMHEKLIHANYKEEK